MYSNKMTYGYIDLSCLFGRSNATNFCNLRKKYQNGVFLIMQFKLFINNNILVNAFDYFNWRPACYGKYDFGKLCLFFEQDSSRGCWRDC